MAQLVPILHDEISTELTLHRGLPDQMNMFPRFRYMGSKYRLMDWLNSTLQDLPFTSALDAFSGSGVVSYLLKSMGKQVCTNDSLHFPYVLSQALIQNNATRLLAEDIELVLSGRAASSEDKFIQRTFSDIFYTPSELEFLDNAWAGLREFRSPIKRSLVLAALLRSCIKRQPRGVFTVSGIGEKYNDGRRDLRLSLEEHFVEQVALYNRAVFSNGMQNSSYHGNIFSHGPGDVDLVYMDPPYVPRSDDNCYMKRYHFLEGLSCYWDGLEIMQTSKVKKIKKPYTPFGYRKEAIDAFDQMFRQFSDSILVLSYSSNAYPGLDSLVSLMKKYKRSVEVLKKPHRYHFGTHVAAKRNVVEEYLIVGM
ncbi:DNA adenine methylase [Pontiellaceae bacterium B12227]|nr:DNA adenine methylase [Pontiellaceae bacterium B12227]